MSRLDAQAAELDYSDHPDDPVNWPTHHQYVTSTQKQRGGRPVRVAHIVAVRCDWLPDGYRAACSRVIRGQVSATPPLRVCPRCTREAG